MIYMHNGNQASPKGHTIQSKPRSHARENPGGVQGKSNVCERLIEKSCQETPAVPYHDDSLSPHHLKTTQQVQEELSEFWAG